MRRKMAALAGIAVMLIAVAGCGQQGEEPEVASASKGKAKTAAKQEQQKGDPQKFAKCLRENGVKVEEFRVDKDSAGGAVTQGGVAVKGDAAGGGDETFKKAHEKCKKYAPVGDGAAQLSEKDKEAMLKQARCMRKEGVDVPDPKFDGGTGEAMPIPGDMKKFEAAMKKCGTGAGGVIARVGGGK